MKFEILTALFLSTTTFACGGSGSTGTGGAGGSGTSSSKATSSSKTVTASVGATTGAGGATGEGTSGKVCTTNADCDVSGAGTAMCTKMPLYGTSATPSTYFPDAICVQTAACDPGPGPNIVGCDADAGICLTSSTSGVCLPFCQFDSTGAKYTGNCPGKDACNPYGFGKDANMLPFGVGYCFGGCLKNADCTAAGETCDVFDGLCKATATIVAPTKIVGAACTGATDTACKPRPPRAPNAAPGVSQLLLYPMLKKKGLAAQAKAKRS